MFMLVDGFVVVIFFIGFVVGVMFIFKIVGVNLFCFYLNLMEGKEELFNLEI